MKLSRKGELGLLGLRRGCTCEQGDEGKSRLSQEDREVRKSGRTQQRAGPGRWGRPGGQAQCI